MEQADKEKFINSILKELALHTQDRALVCFIRQALESTWDKGKQEGYCVAEFIKGNYKDLDR